jgi:hypothetical protein
MVNKKRTSLAAIALPDDAAEAEKREKAGVKVEDNPTQKTAQGSAGEPTGAAKKYKHTSLYLPDGAREQLRGLAYHERAKQHDLILEAIDMLFKARGQKSIKELEEAAE